MLTPTMRGRWTAVTEFVASKGCQLTGSKKTDDKKTDGWARADAVTASKRDSACSRSQFTRTKATTYKCVCVCVCQHKQLLHNPIS